MVPVYELHLNDSFRLGLAERETEIHHTGGAAIH
jgi:hypothetical protein